jgi:hypothetical protein
MRLIVGICLRLPAQPDERWRNLCACLAALNDQTVPRREYEIVVSEDGPMPYGLLPSRQACNLHLFQKSAQPFSRARTLNAVARAVPGVDADTLLCLMDADLYPPRTWVEQCRASRSPTIPYTTVEYLTEDTTTALLRGGGQLQTVRTSTTANGGALWIRAGDLDAVGGYDEQYVGWGCEDDDLMYRLAQRGRIHRLRQPILHLWHPKAERGPEAAANLALFRSRWNGAHAAMLRAQTDVEEPWPAR